MKTEPLESVDDLNAFMAGTKTVDFSVLGRKQAKYDWVASVLAKTGYLHRKKREKHGVRAYIQKITEYSTAQVTRLIQQYKEDGKIVYKPSPSQGFTVRYTQADIRALAALDELHGTLNGSTTKKLCERAWQLYEDPMYERLSTISVAHLYNLRATEGYKRQRVVFNKTKPSSSTIGVRRKPQPNGKPGYLRIDTVHQGDKDKQKGVYHLNAVDEVTQFEIVYTVEKISEHYLIPALRYILAAFPFHILGFHSDNGSEYVNHTVANLLNKLLIEFTKSRPRKSNDNGLVESKNGSIVRKTFGYSHIPSHYAPMISIFNTTHLNYYLNYHRPCLFPTLITDKKGKQTKKYRYEHICTPYEKFKSLLDAKTYLNTDLTFDELDYKAHMMSDSEAAQQMKKALTQLMRTIFGHKEQDRIAV